MTHEGDKNQKALSQLIYKRVYLFHQAKNVSILLFNQISPNSAIFSSHALNEVNINMIFILLSLWGTNIFK